MIWILLSAIVRLLSVDRGRSRLALRLVDPLAPIILLVLVLRGREWSLVTVEIGAVARRAEPGRSWRTMRWRRTSSVMSRPRSSSAMTVVGASNTMMWYEPSRWRSMA